jgi:hypothetical protein
VTREQKHPTRDKALVGAAGVHYVVSELSLRGLIALPTIRNTSGVDVVVLNKEGIWHANLQVKTSRSKVGFWPVGVRCDRWVGPRNYYVFLRYNRRAGSFEAFLEGAEKVAQNVAEGRRREKERGAKPWAPVFYLWDEEDRLRAQWEEFGPDNGP